MHVWNGSFTLTETDFGPDSDSKPSGYIVLHRTFHIAVTQTPYPYYFCIGQESESESVLESVSDNVNELKMHLEYFIQIDIELRFYRSKFGTNAYTVSYLYKTETHEILGKMFVFSTVECTWRNGRQFL